MNNKDHSFELDSVLEKLAAIRNETDHQFADQVMENLITSSPDSKVSAPEKRRLPVPAPSVTFGALDACIADDPSVQNGVNQLALYSDAALEASDHPSKGHPDAIPTISANSRGWNRLMLAIAGMALVALFAGLWMMLSDNDPRPRKVADPSNEKPVLDNLVTDQPDDSVQPKASRDALAADENQGMGLVVNNIPDDESLDPDVISIEPKRNPPKVQIDQLAKQIGQPKPLPTVVDPGIVMPINRGKDDAKPKQPSWQLAVNFDSRGVGKAFINDQELLNVVFHQNLEPVMKQVAMESQRRMAYLEPRIGEPLTGSLCIEDQKFSFHDESSMHDAIKSAMSATRNLRFEPLSFAHVSRFQLPVTNVRSQIAERLQQMMNDAMNMQRGATASIQQFPFSSLKFATPDEVEFVYDALERTDEVIHEIASARHQWEQQAGIQWNGSESSSSKAISNDEFIEFVNTGKLVMPAAEIVSSRPMIQTLNEEQLKLALNQFSQPVDLFRSNAEYARAMEFVGGIKSVSSLKSIGHSQAIADAQRKLAAVSKAIKRNPDDGERMVDYQAMLADYRKLKVNLGDSKRARYFEPLKKIMPSRPDLQGLPLVMGNDCQMQGSEAIVMDQVSKSVGQTLGMFDGFGSRNASHNNSARYSMIKQQIDHCSKLDNYEQGLSTLDQMLQVDHPRLRSELVTAMRKVSSDEAMKRIADRAKFDLVGDVRTYASDALRDFPKEKVRDQLIEGFRYPWAVVAMHSAEALVRLNDTDAVPDLIELLGEPNPRMPQEVSPGRYRVKELVSINHMRNCLLCHAPSSYSNDYGRAKTPQLTETIESQMSSSYYGRRNSTTTTRTVSTAEGFVRADVTYLQQDFSVQHEVENPGNWPKNQRFDYVVRERVMPKALAMRLGSSIKSDVDNHRKAIIFALQSLTGKRVSPNTKKGWLKATQ